MTSRCGRLNQNQCLFDTTGCPSSRAAWHELRSLLGAPKWRAARQAAAVGMQLHLGCACLEAMRLTPQSPSGGRYTNYRCGLAGARELVCVAEPAGRVPRAAAGRAGAGVGAQVRQIWHPSPGCMHGFSSIALLSYSLLLPGFF